MSRKTISLVAWDLEGLEDDLQLAKACLTWFPEPGKHFKKIGPDFVASQADCIGTLWGRLILCTQISTPQL